MQQQIPMAWGIVSICRLGAWHRRLLAKDSILLLFCAVNGVGACSSKLFMVQMYCRRVWYTIALAACDRRKGGG